jgi:hypothetical protein
LNCAELRESLAETEDGSGTEQKAHLKSCQQCSSLMAELSLITSAAAELREAGDPSPRVWNCIEIALRGEGIIRPQQPGRSLIPSLGSHWAFARWIAPAAALVLFTVAIYIRRHTPSAPVAKNVSPAIVSPVVSDTSVAGLNDEDLLQEVGQQTPALKAEYEDELHHVNDYIQDAKGVVAANPNDEEARRSLMEAYQEKAMLFELAMDRSLP